MRSQFLALVALVTAALMGAPAQAITPVQMAHPAIVGTKLWNCPRGTGWHDGCELAPVGRGSATSGTLFIAPDFFRGYAQRSGQAWPKIRPPQNVPGVDFPVGIHPWVILRGPKAAANAHRLKAWPSGQECTFIPANPNSGQFFGTGSVQPNELLCFAKKGDTLDLSALDFSGGVDGLNDCVYVEVKPYSGDASVNARVIFTDDKFAMGPGCYQQQGYLAKVDASSMSVVFWYNWVDGGGPWIGNGYSTKYLPQLHSWNPAILFNFLGQGCAPDDPNLATHSANCVFGAVPAIDARYNAILRSTVVRPFAAGGPSYTQASGFQINGAIVLKDNYIEGQGGTAAASNGEHGEVLIDNFLQNGAFTNMTASRYAYDYENNVFISPTTLCGDQPTNGCTNPTPACLSPSTLCTAGDTTYANFKSQVTSTLYVGTGTSTPNAYCASWQGNLTANSNTIAVTASPGGAESSCTVTNPAALLPVPGVGIYQGGGYINYFSTLTSWPAGGGAGTYQMNLPATFNRTAQSGMFYQAPGFVKYVIVKNNVAVNNWSCGVAAGQGLPTPCTSSNGYRSVAGGLLEPSANYYGYYANGTDSSAGYVGGMDFEGNYIDATSALGCMMSGTGQSGVLLGKLIWPGSTFGLSVPAPSRVGWNYDMESGTVITGWGGIAAGCLSASS